MWYGKDTEELKQLNKEYYNMFKHYPWGCMELEYGADEYEEYVRDIREAIRQGKELPEVVD